MFNVQFRNLFKSQLYASQQKGHTLLMYLQSYMQKGVFLINYLHLWLMSLICLLLLVTLQVYSQPVIVMISSTRDMLNSIPKVDSKTGGWCVHVPLSWFFCKELVIVMYVFSVEITGDLRTVLVTVNVFVIECSLYEYALVLAVRGEFVQLLGSPR